MRIDSLKKYVTLRTALLAEKTKLESRLSAIDRALGSTTTAKAPAAEKPAAEVKEAAAS